jgi:hypothetical protein
MAARLASSSGMRYLFGDPNLETHAMPSPRETLDRLLPLLQPLDRELHLHAAVLEVSDMSQLAELAADPKTRRYLLARLSDTAALVDPGHARDLEQALLTTGHTPKVVEREWK